MKFSKKQNEIIKKITNLLVKDGSQKVTLTGSAGTGKSSITAEIVKKLIANKCTFTLCAPTNKAKMILEDFTGQTANTVHSLLKLRPQLEIQDLDYKSLNYMFPDLKFQREILIVDEASMVNDDLHKFLCDKYEKILAIGDIKQLLPVGQKTPSKFFSEGNIFQLTEVFRQNEDSPLLDVLLELRSNTIKVFTENYNENGGIKLVPSVYELAKNAALEISKNWNEIEPPEVAILAYTNKAVDWYNKEVRKNLNLTEELVEGEKLLARDNFEAGFAQVINSVDYMVTSIKTIPKFNPGFGMPLVYVYEVTLSDYDSEFVIHILSSENNTDVIKHKLAQKAESLRLSAMKHKKGSFYYKKAWQDYFRFMKIFATLEDLKIDNRVVKKATFKYGYARSVHLSQGCSLGSVFIDMRNIQTCFSEVEKRQLQYVALSRTRKYVTIYQ